MRRDGRERVTRRGSAGEETLPRLLERLGVDDWDFLIVGDGSGSGAERAAGWGSVSIERATMERRVWWGHASRGTVNFAEAMAYLHPLDWFVSRELSRKHARRRAWSVHIVTDSEYCRGRGEARDLSRPAHVGVWSALDSYARHGFVLRWHHRCREDVELNRYADRLSRMARQLGERYNLPGSLEQSIGTACEHNPDVRPRRRR